MYEKALVISNNALLWSKSQNISQANFLETKADILFQLDKYKESEEIYKKLSLKILHLK